MDMKSTLQKAFHNLYEIRNLLNIFYQDGQIHLICSTMYDLAGITEDDGQNENFMKAGLLFCAFGIIFQWLKEGNKFFCLTQNTFRTSRGLLIVVILNLKNK